MSAPGAGMRVLLVVFQWSRAGGLEAVTVEVARALAALGAGVEVWSVAQPGDVVVDGIAARGLAPAGGRIARSLDARGGWKRRLAREAAAHAGRFDLVIAGHPWLLPPLHAGLGDGPGRPRCWTWAYGIDVWGRAGRRLASHLAWADRAVAISRFTREQVAPWVRPERLSLIHTPVDTDVFTEGTASAGGADLLIVGRLARQERYKGHEVLFRAVRPLEERLGRRATLRVVGDGDLRPELEREAAALGVADRVEFAGRLPLPELVDAYRGCGVFAMPSRLERRRWGLWTGEGLGIVYLEAQACGRPVIASTDGGAPDAVRPGETGVL
ncbi:MAG TPA: glycosyltransferase family 4 protein, partial [Longimicrobium sp.]|nr:glycosyltransferase family 4 protein [Longimicrobium sp.]